MPAAGLGQRMKSDVPKQYQKLHGKEVLAWTLQTLCSLNYLQEIVLVLHPNDSYYNANLAASFPNVKVVVGGEERQHSVINGLAYLKNKAEAEDWVFVHDAARPCITQDDINWLKTELQNDEIGGILASKVKDTLKQAISVEKSIQHEFHQVAVTLPREDHWLAATPQLFRFTILWDALTAQQTSGGIVTDESAAIEALDKPVKIIEGRSDNIKITSPEDIMLAEFILKQQGKA